MARELNILFLGETGVGKSTFINAFTNYLHYPTLQDVLKEELYCKIPTSFVLVDDMFEEKLIEIGNNTDRNEDTTIGPSSTQKPKTYEIMMNKTKINLIDTPGIGDSRGIIVDKQNIEEILNHISALHKLHAICLVLKPNVTIISSYFKFCITSLFACLEKSALQNIIFLFTSTRSTSYTPGDTLANLRQILNPISIDIPCNKQNVFCVDNEGFRYLVASTKDVNFTEEEVDYYERSWEYSSEECYDMIKYILQLSAHDVKHTIAINDARKAVLSAKTVVHSIESGESNIPKIIKDKASCDVFKNLLAVLFYIYNIRLPNNVLSCTSHKCKKVYNVDGIKRIHNRTCAEDIPIYWSYLNATYLWKVYSYFCNPCSHCGCPLTCHSINTYSTDYLQNQIKSIDNRRGVTLNIEAKKYRKGEAAINKLVHFLQDNAVLPINNFYETYLDSLIDSEYGVINDTIRPYQKMKKKYNDEKLIFEKVALRNNDQHFNVTARYLEETVEDLCIS